MGGLIPAFIFFQISNQVSISKILSSLRSILAGATFGFVLIILLQKILGHENFIKIAYEVLVGYAVTSTTHNADSLIGTTFLDTYSSIKIGVLYSLLLVLLYCLSLLPFLKNKPSSWLMTFIFSMLISHFELPIIGSFLKIRWHWTSWF